MSGVPAFCLIFRKDQAAAKAPPSARPARSRRPIHHIPPNESLRNQTPSRVTVQIAARIQKMAPGRPGEHRHRDRGHGQRCIAEHEQCAARRLAKGFGQPRHAADRRGVLGLGQHFQRAAIAGILAERRDIGAELFQFRGRRRAHDAARGNAHGAEVEGAQRLPDASQRFFVDGFGGKPDHLAAQRPRQPPGAVDDLDHADAGLFGRGRAERKDGGDSKRDADRRQRHRGRVDGVARQHSCSIAGRGRGHRHSR